MDRAEIIEMVKSRIDELSPFTSTELNPSIELIDKLLDDSDTAIRRKIPLHLIQPARFANVVVDNGDGSGYFELPSDFLRLHTFKMSAWTRAITEAISESHPLYAQQKNSVTRGGIIKPVAVIRWLNDPAASPVLGCFGSQTFAATDLQTAFEVTDFSLNDEYVVYVDGLLVSAGHSRTGDVVIFDVGLAEGTEVVILN